jgi:hypothetical protein
MTWPTVGLLVVSCAALWLIDRLLLMAEARGWIYWRRRKASSSSLGSAMMAAQSFLEPDAHHVVEERQRQEADIDVAADDSPVD